MCFSEYCEKIELYLAVQHVNRVIKIVFLGQSVP